MTSIGRSRRTVGFMVGALLVVASCSGSDSSASTTTARPAESTTTTVAVVPTLPPVSTDQVTADALAALGDPGSCEVLDARSCLLPYPSDFFTVDDPTTDTTRRVAFAPSAMPVNASGVGIDPSEWNRNDGFSPNTPILTYVDALDVTASGLPSWTDPSTSLADDSPVVVVDTATAERVAVWAELDARAAAATDQLLVIHPIAPLREGHQYAVALRQLLRTDGAPVEPGVAFTAYRDRVAGPDWFEARRDAMESTFAALTAAGIERSTLTLAWSFTVASTRSISERMLAIRDDSLKELGKASPKFAIAETEEAAPDADGLIARHVIGTIEVPNYLTGDGAPGNGFFYGDDGLTDPNELPEQNGSILVGFRCNIPASVIGSSTPAHLSLYGHGLLGSDDEINAGNVRRMASEHGVIFCATKWAGMSEDDIPNAITALGDISHFSTVTDRLQQGVLNAIFLGRAMTAEDGITSSAAFAGVDVDRDHLVFDGNSQGGIMGLMLTAVSPDISRAVLGVPGMNYSMLLPRSVDFDEYEAVMKPAYPNDLDRMLIIGLMQMLWDRGEGAGYVQHVTSDPYPGNTAKTVLLDVAFGDHQVSELSALVEARALGAKIVAPLAAPGRLPSDSVAYGLEPVPSFPFTGSALVMWDSGASPIPLEAVPPRDGEDPHEDPRADPDVRAQKAAFLFEDQLIDVCSGAPCTADRAG